MIQLYNGDCLQVMDDLISKGIKVDCIITDPPYGTTQNKWDEVIPFNEMWKRLNLLIKDNGAIILFSDGMFTAKLKLSNQKQWRYDLIWDKVLTSGFLNANKMPLRSHEIISLFYKKLPIYNPQKVKGKPNNSKGVPKENQNNNYGKFEFVDNKEQLGDMKHPKSILQFIKPHPSVAVHPTQKPVELLEYLIKTYTNENDTVLDFTMGSGSTGVACKNLNRQFIGIELDTNYFEIAKERMK